MGKKETGYKTKYNSKTYRKYEFRVRMDSELYNCIENTLKEPGASLSYIVKKLLTDYYNLSEEPR